MMIPSFHIQYTRNTRAAKNTSSCQTELCLVAFESCCSCIMLYHSPGKHDIPPEKEYQLPNLPTTLGGLFHVSSQEDIYIYISFWFVNCTTTLHSTFHWPQPCWKLLMYPGKGPMWNVRSSWEYSPSEAQFLGSKPNTSTKTVSCFTSPWPSKTWNAWPFEKVSHSDNSLLPRDLHRFRHPFLLLAHPTSDKAVPGKWCSCPQHVQKDTERNWNIEKWKTCRNAGPIRIRTSRN